MPRKFVTWVDSNPHPPYYYADSIKWDTVTVTRDSIIYDIKDSTIFNYQDSLIFKDTLIIHQKDTLVYTYINCPEGAENKPWMLWVIGGLIISVILFVILYVTKK